MDFRDRVLLAPLTKGGNLPFRRLCVRLGARTTVSEMAYAWQVCKGSPTENALLRRHPDEPCFGVQLAVSRGDSAVQAAKIAQDRGANFIDINCGCPIHDVVKRGMGATLMRRPAALGRIVEAMVKELTVPLTVKLRLGWSEDDINVLEVAKTCVSAGAVAVALHGRTREQRYTRAANWDWVARLVAELSVPVIGNGDILTWYEARDLWQKSGCASVMLGRGALIKPWLFREIEENKEWEPTAEERVGVYMTFITMLKEHFRDDEKGRKRAMFFLPWHLGFFCRYRPLPESRWREASREHPLLQTRFPDEQGLGVLEQLLRDPREAVHARMAAELWESSSTEDAIERFLRLAAEFPPVSGELGEVATAHG